MRVQFTLKHLLIIVAVVGVSIGGWRGQKRYILCCEYAKIHEHCEALCTALADDLEENAYKLKAIMKDMKAIMNKTKYTDSDERQFTAVDSFDEGDQPDYMKEAQVERLLALWHKARKETYYNSRFLFWQLLPAEPPLPVPLPGT